MTPFLAYVVGILTGCILSAGVWIGAYSYWQLGHEERKRKEG